MDEITMVVTPKFKLRMRKMLIAFSVLFGVIISYKIVQYEMIQWYLSKALNEPIVVSSTKLAYSTWHPVVQATASLRAVNGVNVSAELAGTVQEINFLPGTIVSKGTILLKLSSEVEQAALQALQANADLAQITYNRNKKQYAVEAISKQNLDIDKAKLQNALAQLKQQQAILSKKTIRAPFDGNVGICQVNIGQYIQPGSIITTLQNLDVLYADFYLPQQFVSRLKVGQKVVVNIDESTKKEYSGKITSINPLVDDKTRNIFVEATLENKQRSLLPGMFVNATVTIGRDYRKLTLPQSAIIFNPYGSVVFIVKHDKANKTLTAKQVFVVTGETRGDQVAIERGLKIGDEVVTSGQIKLSNGTKITINNSIEPYNNPNPSTPDIH